MLIIILHAHVLQKCGAQMVEFVKSDHFDNAKCSTNDMMTSLAGNLKQKRSNTTSSQVHMPLTIQEPPPLNSSSANLVNATSSDVFRHHEMLDDAHATKPSSEDSMSVSETQRPKNHQCDKNTIEHAHRNVSQALSPIPNKLKDVDAYIDGVYELVLLIPSVFTSCHVM